MGRTCFGAKLELMRLSASSDLLPVVQEVPLMVVVEVVLRLRLRRCRRCHRHSVVVVALVAGMSRHFRW